MAEIILSAALEVLFDKLGSSALKKVARSQGIQVQLKKWKRSLPKIQAVLSDAAQREIKDKSVKLWLYGLRQLAYDMDDVLDYFAAKAKHTDLESGASTSKVTKFIPTCCTSSSPSFRMMNKIDDISTRLQDLAEEKNTLGLNVNVEKSKNINKRLETTSLLVDEASIVGRKGDKEALLEKLLGDESCDKNFSILPIVGMGGIGKTTLAQILYNEARVTARFEHKTWVCVSNEINIFKMSKIIFQSVTKEKKEFEDLNLLQEALKEQFVKKRFLLVLDDVWSESRDEFETLMRPFYEGARGSKIIMTTRKQQLLKKLSNDDPYQLQLLSHDDALSLFSHHALDVNNFDSHPNLRPHGEVIVKKCNGLPLALIKLARLLRTNTDDEEWKQLLNSETWKLEKKNEIVPPLRLSYQDLRAHLKQLFAYCSLFPKDYLFEKEKLILLWMAEGFLHRSTEQSSHECFEELLSRSFFMQAPNEESLYVMHDLMSDVATSLSEGFFIRLDNDMETNVNMEALEEYRHMSFVGQPYEVYGKLKAFERAKNLRTFLAFSVGVKESWQTFYLSNKILVDLVCKLPLLRVLYLSDYEISEVPESIGSLKHLRYLNLSRTRITHLPESISNLCNLQTLFVCGCKALTKMPNNFSKLKNLRHLDISDTPVLEKLPAGISELKCLQTLSKIIIEEANGFAITELKDMKNLCGRISIKGLEKVKSAMDAKNANLLEKKLHALDMEWSDVFDGARNETLEKEVLNVLKPQNDKLRKLGIVSYGGIDFPSWVGDPSFVLLAHVTIHGCKNCTSLPPLGRLPLLKELFVGRMDGVKVVGSELHGTSLEILSFVDMSGWEVWSSNNGDIGKGFPRLRKLSIERCPHLVRVSLEALASLRVLNISGCCDDVLISLVRAASMVTTLRMDGISGLTQLHGRVIEHLEAVEEIIIKDCSEVRYLWESEVEVCKILVKLRKLEVLGCENLVSLGEIEKDNCGVFLRSNMSSLEYIDIQKWSNMKLFPDLRFFSHLTELRITDCKNLESFPDNPLSSLTLLTKLIIRDCPRMVSFPHHHELPNLTSLTHLEIKDCPSMDDSFPYGLWPPKLQSLEIGGLKQPISQWGPQYLPTSLSTLWLFGGLSENVSSCSQLSIVVPPSLTRLQLHSFGHLETLSMGLQHLTSLQHLHISHCPKTKDLPESLLPSLLSLYINECPKLKERYGRRGSPLISHIPCVEI